MATKTLITAEEFLQTGPETDNCELVRGEIVPMPPPTEEHGTVCANVVYLLKAYVKRVGRGQVLCNDAGIITRQEPDSVRGMDVGVFPRRRRTGRASRAKYVNDPADLVVEVRSPSQTWPKIHEKVSEYLAMGCRLVWVIDPSRNRVTVFDQIQEPQVFAAENELDGGDILPGFRCRVAEFFD